MNEQISFLLHMRYWILLLFSFFVLTACSDSEPMTEMEKKNLVELADNGNRRACYEISIDRNNFSEEVRKLYLERACLAGYDEAIIHKVAKESSEKGKVKVLNEGIINGSKIAKYLLAKRYLIGDGVTKDKDRALNMLNELADQGYIHALTELGSFDSHVATNVFTLIQNNFYKGWLSVEGAFLYRMVAGISGAALGCIISPLEIIFMDSPIPWWQGFLLWIGFLAFGFLCFILLLYAYSFDEKLQRGRISLYYMPIIYLCCGILFTLFYLISNDSSAAMNIGSLTLADDSLPTFGARFSNLLTWIMLLSAIVSVAIALLYSKSIPAALLRLAGLAFFSIIAVVLGISFMILAVLGVAVLLSKATIITSMRSSDDYDTYTDHSGGHHKVKRTGGDIYEDDRGNVYKGGGGSVHRIN